MSSGIKTTDFLKMLRGPETKEEAIELIKNSEESVSKIATGANLSAIKRILIINKLTTEEEYNAFYEEAYDTLLDITAQMLVDFNNKKWEDLDEDFE